MKIDSILHGRKGEKLFLLGNEAVVRGALEGGISLASTYPGTPSSEIGDVLFKIAKDANIYFEFSANEKVALEVSAAASFSGLRSFVFMKHVGLNVASDSFMSMAYLGVKGGMVVLSADDPSMFSSQNEQDNRIYSKISGVPLLEPSNPQEMKDFMKFGFEISEKFGLPILIRTTTRVSHMRGIVELDNIPEHKEKGFFKKNSSKYVPVPANSKKMHEILIEKLKKIQEYSNKSDLNKVFDFGGNTGVITSGGSFNYAMDVIKERGLDLKVLKLGFSYPFPRELVERFLNGLEHVIVVEEVEPVIEEYVLEIIGMNKLSLKIHGKLDGTFPRIYEFNPDVVDIGFGKILNYETSHKDYETGALPSRPPVLCPGCPHRATYYAMRKAASAYGLENVIFTSDIGCYTLGIQPPYEEADILLSMGSSIGLGIGFSKATNQKIVSFIGDSTFFHSGLSPLASAVHSKANILVVVLDNRTTAMTGGQPSLSIPINGLGEEAPEVSIENTVRGLGVEFVKTVDPYNIKKTQEIFEEALKNDGVSVVIAKHPCALITDAEKRKKGIWVTFKVNSEHCKNFIDYVHSWACPAFYINGDGTVDIDPALCDGCGVCTQVFPKGAIEVKR
jgi:indolepyruvate ferredoxin oxidoreductase alpha subunit